MASYQIYLNSDDGEKVINSPSDIRYSLNFTGSVDLTNYGLSIQGVSFPNAVYNINTKNNKLYWVEDSTEVTSTLTTNNYTGTQLATELTTQMNNDSPNGRTYAVSYDTQSKKLTVTESIGLPNTFSFSEGLYDCIRETGFETGSTYSTSYQAGYPIYLAGSQYVDIQTDISTKNYSSNGKTNILSRIPITSNFGSIVIYENSSDDFISLSDESLNTIEIRMLDDKGNLFELPGNCQVSIILKLQKLI